MRKVYTQELLVHMISFKIGGQNGREEKPKSKKNKSRNRPQ